MSRQIEAVTVNHNTSIFTELMLRSLYQMHDLDPEWAVTVLDSQSTDDSSVLRAYAESIRAEFHTTELSTDNRYAGNTHGEILRSFVHDHPDCDYYLFLDADIVFFQQATINTMLSELGENGEVFGVQARMSWDGQTERTGGSWNCGGREQFRQMVRGQSEEAVKIGSAGQGKAFRFVTGGRISPVCCLIRNSAVFRSVVDLIGLSCATVECASGGVAFDTFGLMTRVMETHGLRHELSTKMVLHFGGVSYNSGNLEDKRDRCVKMLSEMRLGGGV